MRGRIGLAVLAVGLLAAGVWWTRRQEDRAARIERAESRLSAFDDRAVTAFTLETRSGTWRVVRAAKGWRIASPVDDAASAAAVEALLVAARRAPVVQRIEPADQPSSYGLDPPLARLTLEGVAVPPLELGDVAPTGEGLFARVSGRPGVLILRLPDGAALVAPDGAKLRDPSLTDLPQSAVDGIVLARGGVRLARGDDGWWIEAPRRLPASSERVDELLGAILGLTIVGADDAGAASDPRFGLGPRADRVTLRSGTETRAVTFGADAGGGRRYAASEGRGAILIVDAAPLADMPRDVDALRAVKLTNVNRYHVTEVVYASGAMRFSAKRKDDATWTAASGAAVPAARVYALLVALLEAPTSSWSERAPTGAATATLEYVTEAGARGRVEIFGDRASWSGAPGATFHLASPAPPVPKP
jgi:hypothetical protein